MSDVKTIRDDLIAKISTAVGSGVSVDKWAGEAKAMECDTPAVMVQWTGAITGDALEMGETSAYEQDLTFLIWVATADDPDISGDGDDQAATLFEQIRTTLCNQKIAGLGYAVPYRDALLDGRTESFMGSQAGRYLYAQGWRIEQVID